MLIVGAGNCAIDLIAMLEHEPSPPGVVFYDDVNTSRDKLFDKYGIIKSKEQAASYFTGTDKRFVVATGNPKVRYQLSTMFEQLGGVPYSLISSHSKIGRYNRISDRGVIIMHGVIITNGVSIDEGCLINMSCTLGHGAQIGRFCELSPGVKFSNCKVGELCHLGIGAILIPGIEIGAHVVVGAGAVVTRNVTGSQVVKGVPAKNDRQH